MKIEGIEKVTKNEVSVPIIRAANTIYLILEAAEDLDKFDQLGKPKPRLLEEPGKAPKPIINESFMLNNWELYVDFIVVSSLRRIATIEDSEPDPSGKIIKFRRYHAFTWESIDFDDLSTYKNYREELKAFGLNQGELRRVVEGALEANSITEPGLDKAREDFLASAPLVM